MASTTTPDTSSADLLARVEHGYVASRAVVDALPAERFAEMLVSGWTLKDVVAHNAAWEETVPPRVASALATGRDSGDHDDIDGFNRRVVAEARDATVVEVLARWTAAHAKVVELVRSFEGRDVPRLATDIVEWNTTGHYPDHFADLGAAIRTSAELADIAGRAWVPFRLAVMSLGAAGLDATTPSGWTYKDLVAHVAEWFALAARRLARFRATGDTASPGGTADEINARVVERTRGREVRAILRELDDAMTTLLEEIKELDDRQIHANDDWAIAIVAGDTYGHFAEHHVELFAAVPTRPAELVERMREGWRPFRRALARVGLRPLSDTTSSDWSAKAMLSHLAHWLEVVPDELPVRLRGERTAHDVSAENAAEAADAGSRPAHEVVERLDRAYRKVLDLVGALPADGELPFTAIRLIVGETYGHFAEHLPEIEPWVPRSKEQTLRRFDETWSAFRGALRERGRGGLMAAT
ncbi:MAG TPA: maleylpyruvate isomerase N-terminal domain-containing protein, partial [Candidatus Limnocylindria bacterium]|nr:maleylpyruvate isomerase N-terminal domain-containing protein [Candidatus Limnocylindria bacterium]